MRSPIRVNWALGVAVGGIDAHLQRRQFHPRLHHVFLERLDFIQVRSPRRNRGKRAGSSQAVGCKRPGHAAERRRQRERRRQQGKPADARPGALGGRRACRHRQRRPRLAARKAWARPCRARCAGPRRCELDLPRRGGRFAILGISIRGVSIAGAPILAMSGLGVAPGSGAADFGASALGASDLVASGLVASRLGRQNPPAPMPSSAKRLRRLSRTGTAASPPDKECPSAIVSCLPIKCPHNAPGDWKPWRLPTGYYLAGGRRLGPIAGVARTPTSTNVVIKLRDSDAGSAGAAASSGSCRPTPPCRARSGSADRRCGSAPPRSCRSPGSTDPRP